MSKSDLVPWDELNQKQQADFAALCREYGAEIESIEQAKEYYGNKSKLL